MGQGSSVAMSCGIGHRGGSGPALLWLWLWQPATAPIRPLAWKLPYAVGAALKSKEKKKILMMTKNLRKNLKVDSIF